MKNKLIKLAWIKRTQLKKRPKYLNCKKKHSNFYRPLFCDIDQFQVLESIRYNNGNIYSFKLRLNSELQ